MGMSAGGGSGGVKAEINVTPLVDVVLVLLIIFMVVTPMLQRGKDVTLPKATKQEEKKGKDADPLILSITPDKKMYLEKDAYDAESLERELKVQFTSTPGRKVLLKGDESLTFGDVRSLMNIARKAGAKGIALGVEELKE
ncbi:MAG: ExbD/TolR family protein [Myxococcaceae bacterium]